jgi:hypothetical protein
MSRLETDEDLTVIIRQARLEDNENIWDLFHANCRTWTTQQIGPGAKVIDWVEIHPFYPEKTLKEVMIQGLLGTQKRDDAVKFLEKTTNEQLSPIWDLK